jgi:hypothetical protein
MRTASVAQANHKVVTAVLFLKVAIGLLGLEVARQTRNDGIKKEREAAYQHMLEERYREEQKVQQRLGCLFLVGFVPTRAANPPPPPN